MKALIIVILLASSLLLTGVPVFAAIDKKKKLAQAIANAEGFGPLENIPTRANNPGDLKLGDKYGLGLLGEGITVFPNAALGWAALEDNECGYWLEGKSHLYLLDDSFLTIGHTWVDGPNAPVSVESVNWARNVAAYLGVNTTTTLREWRDS
jgi:hypothetical protein